MPNKPIPNPLDQSAVRRAWEDTKKSRGTIGSDIGIGVVMVTVFGLLGSHFIPSNSSFVISLIFPVIGGVIGLLIGLVIIFLISLGLAYRNQRNDARKILKESYEKPRPNVTIDAPEIIDSEITDEAGNKFHNVFGAIIRVFNMPNIAQIINNPGCDVSAKNVWAYADWFSKDYKKIGASTYCRWEEKVIPKIVFKNTPVGDVREIELKPNGMPYSLVVAIKHKDDECCYAYGIESDVHPDCRVPNYKLDGEKFIVRLTLKGDNIETQIFEFNLFNKGRGKSIVMKQDLL